MLDADLAELYDVPTKVLMQAVKRNLERFPAISCSGSMQKHRKRPLRFVISEEPGKPSHST